MSFKPAGADEYGQGRGGGGRTRRKNRRRACLHVVGVVEVVEVSLQAGDGRRLSALNIAETNGRGAGTDGAGGTQRTAYESGGDGAGVCVGGRARGAGRGGALVHWHTEREGESVCCFVVLSQTCFRDGRRPDSIFEFTTEIFT